MMLEEDETKQQIKHNLYPIWCFLLSHVIYVAAWVYFFLHCTMTSVYEGHKCGNTNISCLTFPFRTLGRVFNIAADTASH